MSKDLANNGFGSLLPVELVAKGRYIGGCWIANSVKFANPRPLPATIIDASDDLEAAEQNAITGDELKVAIRNDKFDVLVGLLQQGASFVNNVANGDRTVIREGGYEARKLPEPRVLLPITTAPTAKRLLTPGKVQCSVRSQDAATKGTNWYITDDPEKAISQWTKVENVTTKYTYENLVPGKEYTICAELNGPRNQRQMSPRATVIA
jgi:hypothetical protein